MITLDNGAAEVRVDPALGASVLRYRLASGRDVFLDIAPGGRDPVRTACFVMAPWCNRIPGQITAPDASVHPIAPMDPAFAVPIHGSALRAAFAVTALTTRAVTLAARVPGPAPFDYRAEVTYVLDGAALRVDLALTHLGTRPLGYGMGLHPWLPRAGEVRIMARAATYQTVDAAMLPTGTAPVSERPEWDFNQPRALPPDLIDTAFGGWDGLTRITSDDGALTVRTDPPLGYYQVYAPDAAAAFYCFEPVSHPVNAHNMPGQPGLWTLTTGQTAHLQTTFEPS